MLNFKDRFIQILLRPMTRKQYNIWMLAAIIIGASLGIAGSIYLIQLTPFRK